MTDQQYISAFRQNNQTAITDFYECNERSFKRSISNKFHTLNADLLAEVYLDSVCRLWEIIKRGKLTENMLTRPLAGYLYGIGEKVMLEHLRKEKELVFDDEHIQLQAEIDIEESLRAYERTEQQQMIQETVNNMGKPCAPLLLKFYWESLSMDDIAIELGYKNADSAKTQKNRCMKKLKTIFSKNND